MNVVQDLPIGMLLGITVLAALLVLLVRQQHPEMGLCVRLLAGAMLLTALLGRFSPLLSSAQALFEQTALSWEYGTVLFKGLGVCLLTQTAADVCRDAGENALASKAELAGKITLLALAVPLFEKVAELTVSMIGGEGMG